MPEKLPLIYSCSGCSSAAQTANAVALSLDRKKVGEMSCIAGIGGDVEPLVKLAKSGRPIVALDGCHLQCVANCLKRHQISPDIHVVLSELGVQKKLHIDFDLKESERISSSVAETIRKKLNR